MRRLAAVGVTAPWHGEWQWFHGNEVGVVASAPGAALEIEIALVDDTTRIDLIPLGDGPMLLPVGNLIRYRVVTLDGAAPVTVELVLRGRRRSGR